MYSFFLLLVLSLVPDHAIYIAVVELNHNSEKLESFLSVKVFADDLQDVIRNFNPEYVKANGEDFVNKNERDISKYFAEHLRFNVNNEFEKMEFTSSQAVGDTYFLNFRIQSDAQWENVQITADFFTEIFHDQSNVLTVRNGEKKYFARLTKAKPSYLFTFD
ncbi:MAG: DUF6702 family protein [Cyclobacteriaceae bacterium]